MPPTTPPAIAPALFDCSDLAGWGFVEDLVDVGSANRDVDEDVEAEDDEDGLDVELFGFTVVVFPSTTHNP